MYQSRLESFFQARSSFPPDGTRVGLLRLPSSVRNRIYQYTGPFYQSIDLNFSNLLIYPYNHYPERLFSARTHCAHVEGVVLRGYDETAMFGEEVYWEYANTSVTDKRVATSGAVPICTKCLDGRSLLFVCRQISEEVLPFFYANNFFTVRQGAPYGLKRLRKMGIPGLQFLKSLTITLGTEDSSINPEELFTLPALLQSKHKSSHVSLAEYEAAIDRLARHIPLDYCELYIAFRVTTFNLIEQVLLPLFKLPILKNCGILPFIGNDAPKLVFGSRTSPYSPHTFLKAPQIPPPFVNKTKLMLRSAIHRLNFKPTMSGTCFRYLELPLELRLRILCFSDLVANDGVQWRPQGHPREEVWFNGPECSCSPGLLKEAGGCVCRNPKLRDAEWQGNLSRENCCEMCRPVSATGLCFCSRTSSHTFSSSCKCRPTRHPLFLVSRQVRKDAIDIYYSLNHFYITPFYSTRLQISTTTSFCNWPVQAFQGLRNVELSLYLSSLPLNALQHIRWLEWLLPTPIDDYLHPKTHAWFDYLDALEMMRNSMNIENLTFVLNMAAEGASFHAYYRDYHSDRWQSEQRIGFALRRLGRLKDCFVYLSRFRGDPEAIEMQERYLEKAIMGREYNSRARGKPLERITAMTRHREHGGFYKDYVGDW